MVKSRRVLTREFKLAAIKELDSGKPLGFVARQLEVSANTLHRWRANSKNNLRKRFPVRAAVSLAASR
jgi:transposase-like protein